MEIATKEEFESKVLSSEIPVLVDFFAEWCGPCRVYAPTLEKIEKEYDGRFRIIKVNVDQLPQLANEYSVRSIPTSIIFKDGSPIDTFIGARPEDELKSKLDAHL